MDNQLRQIIEEAWNDRALLAESRVREAVRAVIEELDKGRLRTAEPIDPSRSANFTVSWRSFSTGPRQRGRKKRDWQSRWRSTDGCSGSLWSLTGF